MMNELQGMLHGMIWPWTIVTILAVTALLCGCSSAVSTAAVSNVEREPTLPESMEHPSEMQPLTISSLSHKLPEITVKSEQLMDAGALYPMEYGTDADVIFFADINHDGEPERITAGADYLLEYSLYMNQGYGAYSLQIHGMQQENGTGRKPLGICHKKTGWRQKAFPGFAFPAYPWIR
uniref:hypothetical protein n=1 Tax=Enterocloster clostridioformis TaxID=1531 RepID=UPI0025A56E9A|nr:hypothetical protein [Enterocloster clostridioformis]